MEDTSIKIQSRINRSLVIHDLDNLVYQKRIRKNVTQIPLPLIQKPNIQKKHISSLNPPSNIKIKSKNITKIKHVEKQIKRGRPKIQSSESKSKSKQKSLAKKIVPIQRSSDSKVQKASAKIIPSKITLQKLIKKNLQIQNIGKNEQNEQIQVKKRGRPRKQIVEEVEKEQKEKNQLSSEQKNQNKNLLAHSKKVLENLNEKHKCEQIISSNFEIIENTRSRKAKINSLKRYNDNDLDFEEEEDSYEDEVKNKKKKICKITQKLRNKTQKQYCLNRIFRKQAKKTFQKFSLDVNLSRLCYGTIRRQFGKFDLIHCELPLEYLSVVEGIGSLMEKGFIFVWAQKNEIQMGYHLMNRWGYDVIDQIMWIKANQSEGKIIYQDTYSESKPENQTQIQPTENTNSSLFLNSRATCLVGYKCPLGAKAEYRTKISNNIIFALPQQTNQKPDQIYQIADLMMPGAKKLQIGSHQQDGWLTLKHHETSLIRCHSCFKNQNLFLIFEVKLLILCRRCIQLQQNQKNQEQNQISSTIQVKKMIKIKQLKTYSPTIKVECSVCHIQNSKKSNQFIELNSSEFCSNCFQERLKTQSVKQLPNSINILSQRMLFFNTVDKTCSSCLSNKLFDSYFQCTKCKEHIACKNCFWKRQDTHRSDTHRQDTHRQDTHRQDTQKQGKALSHLNKNEQVNDDKSYNHEWKVRIIKRSPERKVICYGCRVEVEIAYWCCQTCQNWFWCGKCVKGSNEIHPHYQTNSHKEYLMI